MVKSSSELPLNFILKLGFVIIAALKIGQNNAIREIFHQTMLNKFDPYFF